MKKAVISIGLCLSFLIIVTEALPPVRFFQCRYIEEGIFDKFLQCKSVDVGRFEMGDNKSWKHLTDTRAFKLESKWVDCPSSFRFTSKNMLAFFPDLRKIYIIARNISFSSNVTSSALLWNDFTNSLFTSVMLQTIWLEGGRFNQNQHLWALPGSLKELTFINQNYASFDLQRCPDLINLTIKHSRLRTFPSLFERASFIKFLVLDGNPLYNFTVNDIASLCKLEYLSFNYSSLGSQHRSCECRRLKEWVEYLNLHPPFEFRGTFTCNFTSPTDDECKNMKFTLDDAMAKRNKTCLPPKIVKDTAEEDDDETTEEISSADWEKTSKDSPTTFIVLVISVMIILIALSSGGAYIYLNYIRSSNVATQDITTANQFN